MINQRFLKGRIFRLGIFLLMTISALTPAAAAGLLEMTESEQQLLGIEVQVVAPAAFGSAGELTLRVGFSPDGEWAIKTPLPGVLERVWVQVGDRVKAGDPLVMVRSPDVVSLQRDYLKAAADMTLQESAWARDKKLSEAGSVSNRRWQETLYAYETARAEFAGLKAELKLAGFSDADLQRLSRDTDISPDITLRAPVDAIVLQRPAMLGDRLEGAELLASLGEPDKLVLTGMLSSQAAAHLEEGMNIVMQGMENKAVITLVSNVIDPDTQTILIRAEPRASAGLVPGQLTRWNIQSGGDLLMVPSSAIVKLDGLDVAYRAAEQRVRTPSGRCARNGNRRLDCPGRAGQG